MCSNVECFSHTQKKKIEIIKWCFDNVLKLVVICEGLFLSSDSPQDTKFTYFPLTLGSFSRLWGAASVVIFNTVMFLLIVAHLRAVLSDPGIVPIPKTSMDFSDMHSGEGGPRKTVSGARKREI